MAVDALQDVSTTVRLRAVIEGVYTLAAPWGYAETPDDHAIAFLFIIDGGQSP
jgi:hypothetical protein